MNADRERGSYFQIRQVISMYVIVYTKSAHRPVDGIKQGDGLSISTKN